MTEYPPTVVKMNPLLDYPLPNNDDELEKLEVSIGKKMSEVNFQMNQATQKMILYSQNGLTVETRDQDGIKRVCQQEIKMLSQRLMQVIHKRNEISSKSSSSK